MDAHGKVRIGDIVALPSEDERELFSAAYDLVSRFVNFYSYHEHTEERLDTWMSRDQTSPFDGVASPHAVSLFRHSTRRVKHPDGSIRQEDCFGPWVQYIGLSKPDFGITLVHELAHLIDRYHESPRTQLTVRPSNPVFADFFQAYATTKSARRLNAIRGPIKPGTLTPDANELRNIQVMLEGGKVVRFTGAERVKLAEQCIEFSKSQEIFARCMTAFIIFGRMAIGSLSHAEQRLTDQYLARMGMFTNALFGNVLDEEDYDTIKEPLARALRKNGWLR